MEFVDRKVFMPFLKLCRGGVWLFLFMSVFGKLDTLTAQSRKQLEQKRKRLNTEIKNTSKLLNQTAASRKMSMQELTTLQTQVEARAELIEVIQKEMKQIVQTSTEKQKMFQELEGELLKMKQGYKKILIQLYRYKTQRHSVLYILSTDNFNKMYQRQIYLAQLEKRRRQQAILIRKTQENLNTELQKLDAEKKMKATLLKQKLEQKKTLDEELTTKDKMVQKLKRKEQTLRRDLKAKAQSKNQLNRKIEAVIRAQIAAVKASSRQYTRGTRGQQKSYIPNSSGSIGKSFASQQGKLPKPVSNGVLISRFGRHQHPILKQVVVNNNGIDFRTPSSTSVKAVYAGQVVSVFSIPGSGNAVMLKHGNYYTTYSNLSVVNVKRGQQVYKGTIVGKVGKELDSGTYILHFELWNGKNKVDPELWLR